MATPATATIASDHSRMDLPEPERAATCPSMPRPRTAGVCRVGPRQDSR
jgi:hypothetical protein